MTSFSGEPGDVRTETFDLDLRRRNGQFLPVRLYHRVAFGQDGRPGLRARSSSTARPASTWTRASAPPRCASRASSTTRRWRSRPSTGAGRIVQANAPFTRLFGTLPRTGEGGEGPLDRRRLPRAATAPQLEAALEGGGREPERHPAARTAALAGEEDALGARLGDAGERRGGGGRERRSSTPSTPPSCARCRSSSRSRRR